MKYTSILAGALGLMALAACNDEDAVVEQPNVVRTITVTWGNGADTRLSMSNTTEGLKTSWTAGDKILVKPTESSAKLIYQTDGSGQKAVFNLVGDVGPKDGAECNIYYPSTALNGIDLSQQTGLLKDQQNYIAAAGTATFTNNGLNSDVTLQPATSYLYIPAGTVFPLLNTVSGGIFDEATIIFSAPDLITGHDPETGNVKGNIIIDAGTTPLIEKTSDAVKAAVDIYIAIPVSLNPISTMTLNVRVPLSDGVFSAFYGIVKGAKDSNAAQISEAGRVYIITSDNLYPIED